MRVRCVGASVGLALASVSTVGCSGMRTPDPVEWQSIRPQPAAATFADHQPERLDYARFPEAVVHHPDNREPVESTERPYRCIGQLMIYYPDGTAAQSTAFLVGPEHILTAADGFVGPAGAREFDRAVFTPALRGDQKPHGSASVVRVAVPEPFVKKCDQFTQDIAVASLDRRIGDETGHLTFDFGVAAHEVTGAAVTMAGYAADRGSSTMVRAVGRIERNGYPGVWWHDLDAAPGQNGSPLWIERDGEPLVIGIYVRGFGRHSYASGPELVQDSVVRMLESSIAQHVVGKPTPSTRSIGCRVNGRSVGATLKAPCD